MANEIVKCRTMPREVEAVLWDGEPDTFEQLKTWGCYVSKPDKFGVFYLGVLDEEEIVELGYWIVKDPDEDHMFWPEPPEKFALWFVPIVAAERSSTDG